MVDYTDAMGNMNGAPMTEPEAPAQPQPKAAAPVPPTADQTREIQALLRVSGRYAGTVNGEPNKATDEALAKFQKDKNIDPAKATTDSTLAAMRDNVKTSPQAVANMKALAAQGGQDNAFAVEYGLRAKGAMVVPGGRTKLDGALADQTVSTLGGVEKTQMAAAPSAPATPGSTAVPAADATAATAQTATPNPAPQVAGMEGIQAGFMQLLMKLLMPLMMMLGGLFPSANAAQPKPNAPAPTAAAPTPSQSQVRAVDNKLDAAPKPAAATSAAPAGGVNTTTGAQAETDNDRRARLGMTEKQYNGLLADQSQWQADARTGGATGDSPFVRADRQDATMQQKLGLDPIAWMALKKENKDWQTKVDAGDTTLPKVGPMQQAYADSQSKAALAAAPAAPKPESAPVAVARAPAAPSQVQPQQQRAYTEQRPDGGVATVVPVQYEQAAAARARPPRYEGEVPPARAQFGQYSGQDQLNRTLAERAELRAQGYAPQVAAKLVEDNRRAELSSQGIDPRRIESTIRAESSLANTQERAIATQQRQFSREDQQYSREMQRDQQRAEAERRRDVAENKRDWGNVVRGGVTLGGGTSREAGAAGQVAGGVIGILGGLGESGNRGTTAQQRQADRQFGTDIGNAGRGAAVLGGANGREAAALGNVLRSGTAIFQKMGFTGGESGAQGRVVEYPQQQRGNDDRPQTGKWDSNQISGEQRQAGSYGATADERAQILMDYHARQRQSMEAAPAAENASLTNRDRQITGGFSGPT